MSNIVWHDHKVTRAERSANKNQKPCLLWFTGLSDSGKSTIANALDVALHERAVAINASCLTKPFIFFGVIRAFLSG